MSRAVSNIVARRAILTSTTAGPSRGSTSTLSHRCQSTTSSTSSTTLPPLLPPSTSPSLPTSPTSALSLLRSTTSPSQGLYIIARLHSRDYLLHPKDILTVPGPLKTTTEDGKTLPVAIGTTLSLNRIKEVGSASYILKPATSSIPTPSYLPSSLLVPTTPILPSSIVSCSLTVLEHTKSPLQRKLLKKRRKGYEKTIQHKQGWTRLRVGDIVLGQVEGGQ